MKKGFSLIEILILCFIGLSILILVIGVITNSREFARTIGCVNNIKNIGQAIESYQVDWKETPTILSSLFPAYLNNEKILQCPNDKTNKDSYSKFYIGRFFVEEDANKAFILCPRHFGGKKTIVGYLSYTVDIGKSKKILWSKIPAEYGKVYSGGKLNFEDGTEVEVLDGEVGIVGSFINTDGKIYSIIYTPEGGNTKINVSHQGDSIFEVVTPAVIAGVEGTKFTVENIWYDNEDITRIFVEEGKVKVSERNQGRSEIIKDKEEIEVRTKVDKIVDKSRVPKKPNKERPHIIKKNKLNI